MFIDLLKKYNWDDTKNSIYKKTSRDVEYALSRDRRDLDDFMALISPAAVPYLEEMAQQSHQRTLKRFGKTIQLYIPLYLSNVCQNICTYCGFSLDNKIRRRTLTETELLEEAAYIKDMGFEHILLVTGEANRAVGVEYMKHAIELIRPYFASISLEVQPLDEADYVDLIEYGLNTVYIYQETYHQDNYKNYHLKGKKTNFDYRVSTPDRLGKAGVHKIGLGALIGLEDWRTDSFFTALHLQYLERTYWKTKYSIAFPRLRPAEGILSPNVVMTDRELVQLICAYRLLDEEVELSLSTRESENFRNNVMKLGITQMSAGSKTNPGGYTVEPESLEQFAVSDERSAHEIANMIRSQGYEAVWKDWDHSLVAM